MEEKFIPYGKQKITEDDINSVIQVLRSDFITQGDKVPQFEQLICKSVNAKYATAVNSATSGLHLACLSLGLGKGDILWTSPITFVASANCGRYCGAEIDFVDIDEKNGLVSIEKLKLKLVKAKQINKLPKILIPVHLSGSSCNMRTIKKLSDEYGFKIIEDASHAIGGKYLNSPVGNCNFSDITVFSFHPVKIITSGEGGIITTNNKLIDEKIKMLRSHGITKDIDKFKLPRSGPWAYEQQELGFNFRMTDIQASLVISQLNRLKENVEKRNSILNFYKKSLSDISIEFLEIPPDSYSACHLAIIKLVNFSKDFHKLFFENMRLHGIGVQLHYYPVHLQPYYRSYGFKEGDFPAAEKYAISALSIPLFPDLKKDEQIRVINTIKKAINTK